MASAKKPPEEFFLAPDDGDYGILPAPISPEQRKRRLLLFAQQQWRSQVATVAQSLAVKHKELSPKACVERAVALANELSQVKPPDVLPLEEDSWPL